MGNSYVPAVLNDETPMRRPYRLPDESVWCRHAGCPRAIAVTVDGVGRCEFHADQLGVDRARVERAQASTDVLVRFVDLHDPDPGVIAR